VAPRARKAAAKALRERKEAVKPRSQWLREAQTAFNAYIRKRDESMPCISCGRFHDGQWHAGHYLSTGARPELRFDEANVWRQCQPCNTHLHGNLVLYRAELIRRIGLAEVERLEGPHQPCKWTVTELKAIRDEYRAKVRAL
jgi:5-methylcytosine-specific restriction endonuclease McrA